MTTDTILAKNPRYVGANEPVYDDAKINAAKVTLLEPAFGEVVEALAEASSTLEILTHGLQHLTFMEVREKVHKALQAAAEVTKKLEGLK